MNKFVFIIPAFNAENTISRTLMSICIQTYCNWKIIIRDDMSTDSTVDVVNQFVNTFGLHANISIVSNKEKKWEVRNILEMLDECESNDIVCRLDGDDWLCDSDALTIIDRKYQSTGCDVLWTKHRWSFSDMNISGPLPKDANPYKHRWVSSHFKTFRKKMIEEVSDENFRGQDGEYFKRIGDQAIYLPVLHQSKGNWHFEPIVAYHYTIDMNPETFQSDDAKFQKLEGEFLRQRGFVE
jgi:glycosyltransferase involved in cell wall biosynthesis